MSTSADTGAPAPLSDTQKKQYNTYILKAKEMLSSSENHEALRYYQRAYQLHPSNKLDAKIAKLMVALNITDTVTSNRTDTSSSSTLSTLSSDNKRACPHTPIKHEEKRRSPGPTINQTNENNQLTVNMEISEDKENLSPKRDDEIKAPVSDDLPCDMQTLLQKAKDSVACEDVMTALRCYQKAHKIEPSEKLERRIDRMKNFLAEQGINVPLDKESGSAPVSSDNHSVTDNTASDTDAADTDAADTDAADTDAADTDAADTDAADTEGRTADAMPSTEEQIIRSNQSIDDEVDRTNSTPAKPVTSVPAKHTPASVRVGGVSHTPSSNIYDSVSTPGAKASLNDEEIAIYNSLLTQAKSVVRTGDFEQALSMYEQAYLLHPSEKLADKINKIKTLQAQYSVPGVQTTTEDGAGDSVPISTSVVSPDDSAIEAHFTELVSRGRKLIEQEKLKEALELYKDAYGVKPSEKLQRKIDRIQEYLNQQSTDVPEQEGAESRSVEAEHAMVKSEGESTTSTKYDPAERYNDLILQAKDHISNSEVKLALKAYQEAAQIKPSDKLSRKIQKCQDYIESNEDQSAEFSHVGNGFYLHQTLQAQYSVPGVQTTTEDGAGDSVPISTSVVSPDDSAIEAHFTELVSRGRKLIEQEKLKEALELYKDAYGVKPSEKLQRKIDRIQEYLNQQSTDVPEQEGAESRSVEAEHAMVKSEGESTTSTKYDPAERYNDLILQAKDHISNSEVKLALKAYQEAAQIKPSDKLSRKIQKCQDYIESNEDQSAEFSHVGNGFYLHQTLQAQYSVPGVQTTTEDGAGDSVPISTSVVSPDDSAIEAHFTELVSRGRKLIEQEKLKEALELYKDAYGVKPSEKLQRKIDRIQEYLNQQSTDVPEQEGAESRSVEAEHAMVKSEGESTTSTKYDPAERYNDLILQAKDHISNSEVKLALKAYQEAAQIKPSDKLSRKIQKCQDYIESNEDQSAEFSHVGNGFYLHQDLFSKLYPHQKESLLWFWGLHKKKTGGILADDMGLGKTIQVIAFLSGLFDAEEVKTVIIVMPLSLIENWKRELEKWAPGIQVQTYHGGSLRERARATAKIQRRGGVLLTSYGMIVSSAELIAKKDGESFGREFKYDYVILDEGHKIKNPTKTSKGVHLIAARHRIILTGTPIQNNLKEMWALFDWTHHGMLLGTARTFQTEYNRPIIKSREKCATYGERRLGEQMADSLKRIIAPYLLRRTKAEVKAEAKSRGHEGVITEGPEMPNLKRKNDFVVWCYLSELQQNIYQSFSEQDEIKELLNTSKSPLTALVVLKKICDHPRLMSNNQCHKLGLFTPQELLGADGTAMKDCAANRINSIDDEILIKESGKLRFLVQLMAQLKQEKHRTLIFSMSRKMLDIIQKVLRNRGHNVMRMDGTITDLSEREKCVRAFQESDIYDTFLLTTQVGGVGLTLTAADRVIIFDPSWNPATDSQAVDRAFRIGQQKNVAIYRFISCGTIEEKIYRRQVFKDSLNRQTMQKEEKNLFRYFSNLELYELFQLDNPMESKTQQQLEQMHAHQRVTDTALDEHIAHLYSCHMYGLSDHDLMFSKEDEELDGDDDQHPYIEDRVNKAMELLSREAELQSKMNEEEGKYLPGHLKELPKPSVKPAREYDTSDEYDPAQSERLFPEYDYTAEVEGQGREEVTELRPENDWRQHVASTPNKRPADGSDVGERLEASTGSHHTLANHSHHTTANHSHHTTANHSSNMADESGNVEEMPVSDQSIHELTHHSNKSVDHPTTSRMAGLNRSHNVSDNSIDRSMAVLHVDTYEVEMSKSSKHDSRNNMSAEFDDDEIDLNDIEASERSAMSHSRSVTVDHEEEILAAESDTEFEEVVADDSAVNLIEDSQSGSLLGDDFGHLHQDYTVKDSGDEASFTTSPVKSYKRRSTYLAQPQIDTSFQDEDGDGLGSDDNWDM